ncbi:MAG: tRNA (adenine(22)-N(1))-methyltransferase TrmK [Pirellulaceae bacterium]|nr:tRNA (adenine(22)-N(1))-methyltransferase TrmK [Pirellulaceae bacterium]
MLKRTLESEVMDSSEEALVYDQMDHASVNRLFVNDLLAAGLPAGETLDLGTGSARIPIELCQRSETARVVAVDLSINMLDTAKINLELANLTDRILLDHIDAKQLPYGDNRFQLVMSNSIVHHIPDPQPVIRDAVRVTAEDGLLFFRDLMRPDNEEQLEGLVELYAGSESEFGRQMFHDSLHAALSLNEIRALIKDLGFPADSVQPTSDRHWTWIGRPQPLNKQA